MKNRIAVHRPAKIPYSIKVYLENVVRNLDHDVYEIIYFQSADTVPDADLYWFPYPAGGDAPSLKFLNLQPLVITLHGAAPFSLPLRIFFNNNLKRMVKGAIHNIIAFVKWQLYKKRVSAVITVSEYAKEEISEHLWIDQRIIHPIYHGVDNDLFYFREKPENRTYLLNISQYQPKKNLERLIEAYEMIDKESFPELLIISPGFPKNKMKEIKSDKIKILDEGIPSEKVAEYMQYAIGFVFPSLHETFGMPVIEAMACGTPVITSSIATMKEIAGDDAIFVDPYSAESICEGMIRLVENQDLRESLSKHSLSRAKKFSWEKCAEQHNEIFEVTLGISRS